MLRRRRCLHLAFSASLDVLEIAVDQKRLLLNP